MRYKNLGVVQCSVYWLFVAFSGLQGLHAASVDVIYSFDGTHGINPTGTLALSGSALYGMTEFGIFKWDTKGTSIRDVIVFSNYVDRGNGQQVCWCPWPHDGLTINGSTVYGMTSEGEGGLGNVFRVNTDGTGFANIHSFVRQTEGCLPFGTVTLSGSRLYGMTNQGGPGNGGTIFSVNSDGTGYKTLLALASVQMSNPHGGLTLSGSTLYGMTSGGTLQTSSSSGTVFKINTDGSGFQSLHSFNWQDGECPIGNLTLVGNFLYGTTYDAANALGTVFRVQTDGTEFQTLHTFNGLDGEHPYHNDLTICGSTLYGMTSEGGTNDCGTIFSMNTDGSGFQTLVSFDGTNGSFPCGGLTVKDSMLYGMTSVGGAYNDGVIFALAIPEPGSSVLLGIAAVSLLLAAAGRRFGPGFVGASRCGRLREDERC
jgi:uncharacterized repeat protein (TIGR03803 family)